MRRTYASAPPPARSIDATEERRQAETLTEADPGGHEEKDEEREGGDGDDATPWAGGGLSRRRTIGHSRHSRWQVRDDAHDSLSLRGGNRGRGRSGPERFDVDAIATAWKALTKGRFSIHPERARVIAPRDLATYATKPETWSPSAGTSLDVRRSMARRARRCAARGDHRRAPNQLEEYPDEVIAEARVVAVRPHSAVLLSTRATQPIAIGDRAQLRNGY